MGERLDTGRNAPAAATTSRGCGLGGRSPLSRRVQGHDRCGRAPALAVQPARSMQPPRKLEFEDGASDVMGYLNRMGFFDHRSPTVDVLPQRPAISAARRYEERKGTFERYIRFRVLFLPSCTPSGCSTPGFPRRCKGRLRPLVAAHHVEFALGPHGTAGERPVGGRKASP